MIKREVFNILFTTTLLTLALGSTAGADDFTKSTPELISRGKAVYMTNCLTCHGEAGDGNGPAGQYMNPKPRNFVVGEFKKGAAPAQLFHTVTKGLDGTSMAGFPDLPVQDRWAVVHYIRTFKK